MIKRYINNNHYYYYYNDITVIRHDNTRVEETRKNHMPQSIVLLRAKTLSRRVTHTCVIEYFNMMIGPGSTEVTCLQYCNSEADDSELLKILNKYFLVTSE